MRSCEHTPCQLPRRAGRLGYVTLALKYGAHAENMKEALETLSTKVGFVLVVLHRVLAYWSRRSHAFGLLIKGRSDVIVRDGHVDDPVAKRNRLSEHDLLEDLRLNGNVRDIRDVALAVFERNGHISVVRREPS